MLRSNLATRPFYNERAAHVAIGAAAVLVLAVTLFNAVRIVTLSRHNTELSSRTAVEHAEADRLTAEAARIRKTINNDELAQIVSAAQEANALIDQRTFSWTEFFNRIEATLPPDVMLTSVRPSLKDGVTHVAMVVLAKRAEDLDEFQDKLEATGAFESIVAASTDRTDTGLHRAVIESIYTGVGDDSAEPEAAAPAATGPAATTPAATAPPATAPAANAPAANAPVANAPALEGPPPEPSAPVTGKAKPPRSAAPNRPGGRQ